MRIATSTMYDNQTASIDNLVAQQAQYSAELSSGKKLVAPSDDPQQIGQDLAVRSQIAAETQGVTNAQNASAELTTVDGALSSLTSVLQSARSLASQGASGFTDPTQRQALASQVNSLLQEAVSLANTTYSGKYVFAGSTAQQTPPVAAVGEPISSVTFSGNENAQSDSLYNGDTVSAGASMRQAFNFNSSDGSPDIFQTLINLRDSLSGTAVTSESAGRVNNVNTAFSAGPVPVAQAINTAGILSTPLVADSNGNVNIMVTTSQAPNGVTIAIPAASTVPAVVAAINAQTAATGVTASFDYKQQRLVLQSASGAVSVSDVASAGAAAAGNFTTAFGLQTQADSSTDLSRQLGDIDNSLQTVLSARATIGGTIQTLTTIGSNTSSQITNDTQVQSNIEDADIAKVATQFSQSQTALQAAYATTTRIESKSLFDYLQ